MRKLLISIMLVLLIILTYYVVFNGMEIFGWESKNISKIKTLNDTLEQNIKKTVEVNNQQYPQSLDTLKDSITGYKKTKEKYENKIKYISDNVEFGITQIKRYKVETLWITLENYAKKEGVELLLNVVENTDAENSYNLEITVAGEYIPITDFVYDIEGDDDLGFKIEDFEMHQYRKATTVTGNAQDVDFGLENPLDTTQVKTSPTGSDVVNDATNGKITVETPTEETTTSYDPKWVEATFIIKNVEIDSKNGEFN